MRMSSLFVLHFELFIFYWREVMLEYHSVWPFFCFHSQPGFKQMKILRQERHTVCFIEFEVSLLQLSF